MDYMDTLLSAARYYGSLGYVPVACKAVMKNGKQKYIPYMDGWNKESDPADVLCSGGKFYGIQWLEEDTAGIAISCNSSDGLFVLDIDAKYDEKAWLDGEYRKNGYLVDDEGRPLGGKALMNVLAEELDYFKGCPISTTKSGGYHVYYRCTLDRWGKRKQAEDIPHPTLGQLNCDIRTPGNGCVIEAPTPGYFFIAPNHRLCAYRDLPELPACILDWIAEDKSAEPPVKIQNTKPAPSIPLTSVVGLNQGIIGSTYYKRLDMKDDVLGLAVLSAKEDILNADKYPRYVKKRSKSFLRVCNALWWGFLLPDQVALKLALEWVREACWDETDKVRERIRTARNSIPASYPIGWGLRNL